MTLVNRKTREILGYDIARDRSLQRIQNLVDNAPKAELYFSDAFPVYSQICYEGVYRALNNKSQTFTVEYFNADIRHYISIFHRKSRIVNPDVFFVLLILFSLSLKFSFLLSINFLLLNFVSIILNIILLFLRFYLDPHPCQLSWGSPNKYK
jgi:IS1 family transposase